MSQNFAHFVGQLGIQNLIISDSFKFSAPLVLGIWELVQEELRRTDFQELLTGLQIAKGEL